MKFLLLILKNIGRNPLRSLLTALGTMFLVLFVNLVWSILAFLDQATADKSHNFKAIVTERWRVPSLMPFSYATTLAEGAARHPSDVRPDDSMTWQFYGGTLTPGSPTRENILFAIAMEPKKVLTMLDELDNLPPDQAAALAVAARRLEQTRHGIILGRDRMTATNRRVGDRMKIYSTNFKGIDLEFEIVGTFPPSRYDNSAVMNRDYLNAALDAYPGTHAGVRHYLADRSMNLMWLRLSDKESFSRVATQITTSPYYTNPAVKCETASSLVTSALEAFRDLIWGLRFLLAPSALVILSLVIAIAISISVRERRLELAVLKVLGFRPNQLLLMVMGEGLLVGTLGGLLSSTLTYWVVNHWMGGLKFPIGFFASFYIPAEAIWWGTGIGACTSLLGSALPAWSARSVRVADVFSQVA